MLKNFTLLTLFAALIGLVIGVGSYTFIYGKGYAYLSDDPKACVNCHVMKDQFESWEKSSHKNVATCNSCHTPENFYMKYINKAENGFWHSLKFTAGNYKDPIRIRKHNFEITMNACFKCHSGLINSAMHADGISQGKTCVNCHRAVGHTH